MSMKRQAAHHRCTRGKKVRILSKKYGELIGKYIETKSQVIVIEIAGERVSIAPNDMINFGICR